MKYKIGQKIVWDEERVFEDCISGEQKAYKSGTEWWVTASQKPLMLVNRRDENLILPKDTALDGFDGDEIARFLYLSLQSRLPMDEMLEGYDLAEKDVLDAIVMALDKLWMM